MNFSALMPVLFVLTPVAQASGPAIIGTLDVQKALQLTTAGRQAKTSLDVEYKKRKEGLDKKKAEIDKHGEELEKKRPLLSEQGLLKKQAELQEEMLAFQKSVSENQIEIQKKQESLLAPLLEKMKKVTDTLIKTKGILVVLESTAPGVFVSQKETDLTDEVAQAFEKEK